MSNDLSIFNDNRIGISLQGEVNKKKPELNDIIFRASDVVEQILLGKDTIESFGSDEVRYVVNMTDEIKEAIKNGAVRLDTNKMGETFAQLRDANGKFNVKLPISKELVAAGINPLELTNAIQMKAIEKQLDDICAALDNIKDGVNNVMKGQENDRIGLFYSGMDLYREAQQIADPQFAKFIQAQAIKTLSDSNQQMMQSLLSDMNYLLNKEYLSMKKEAAKEIDRRIASINNSFEVICKSFTLKTAIYYNSGETNAMISNIESFRGFLESTIVPAAPKLRELDKNDTLIAPSQWKNSVELLDSVDDMRLQLSAPENNILYLGRKEVVNG